MKNWKQLALIVILSVFVASFFTVAQVPTSGAIRVTIHYITLTAPTA